MQMRCCTILLLCVRHTTAADRPTKSISKQDYTHTGPDCR